MAGLVFCGVNMADFFTEVGVDTLSRNVKNYGIGSSLGRTPPEFEQTNQNQPTDGDAKKHNPQGSGNKQALFSPHTPNPKRSQKLPSHVLSHSALELNYTLYHAQFLAVSNAGKQTVVF